MEIMMFFDCIFSSCLSVSIETGFDRDYRIRCEDSVRILKLQKHLFKLLKHLLGVTFNSVYTGCSLIIIGHVFNAGTMAPLLKCDYLLIPL